MENDENTDLEMEICFKQETNLSGNASIFSS